MLYQLACSMAYAPITRKFLFRWITSDRCVWIRVYRELGDWNTKNRIEVKDSNHSTCFKETLGFLIHLLTCICDPMCRTYTTQCFYSIQLMVIFKSPWTVSPIAKCPGSQQCSVRPYVWVIYERNVLSRDRWSTQRHTSLGNCRTVSTPNSSSTRTTINNTHTQTH